MTPDELRAKALQLCGAAPRTADEFFQLEENAAAVARAYLAAAWQPIETAPKAGPCEDILLYAPRESGTGRIVVGHWAFGGGEEQPRFGPAWFFWTGYHFAELRTKPTHWQPLPAAPLTESPA